MANTNKERVIVIAQVLKEEVRLSITQAATQLFLANGFEKTTMAGIAHNATVSKSNLYNYFASKEELFYSLTDAVALDFQKMIHIFASDNTTISWGNIAFADRMTDIIYRLIRTNKEGLMLLISASGGTKHESIVDNMVLQIAGKIHSAYFSKKKIAAEVSEVISRNLFDGIIALSYKSSTDKMLYLNVKNLISYHVAGLTFLAE